MTSFYNKSARAKGRTINYKGFFSIIFGLALTLSFITGCEEDPSQIGGSILPNSDFNSTQATDTVSVKMFTSFTDTIRSENPYGSYVGSIDDPVFGLTSSAAVSQVWLYSDWPNMGIARIDSVMFYLHIAGVQGEMGGSVGMLNVYEIDEYLHKDSVYYVNRDIPLKSIIASIELSGIDSDTLVAIKLPNFIGGYMLRDTSMLFLSSGEDDFRTFFNGLYFEYIQPVNDHMVMLDLINGQTFINVLYTNNAGSAMGHTFPVNSKCVRYNRFIHDFSTADADKKINHINDGVLDSLSYIQNFHGVYTTVTIPGLEGLKGLPISINKARLFLPVFTDEVYFPEADIFDIVVQARYTDNDGIRRTFPDYQLSERFFDGAYYSLDQEYRINLVNFVQMYLDGEIAEPTFELYLPAISDNRLILRSNSVNSPVRLELVYSEY